MGSQQSKLFFPEYRGLNSGRKHINAAESPKNKNWGHINGMIDVHGPRLMSIPAIDTAYSNPVRMIWKWVDMQGVQRSICSTDDDIDTIEYSSSWIDIATGSNIGMSGSNLYTYDAGITYYEGTLADTPYTTPQHIGTNIFPSSGYRNFIEFSSQDIVFDIMAGGNEPPATGWWSNNWGLQVGITFAGNTIYLGDLTSAGANAQETMTMTDTIFALSNVEDNIEYDTGTDDLLLNWWIKPYAQFADQAGYISMATSYDVRFLQVEA